MRNVTLPMPLFIAGGVLCVLAGLLGGALLGPGTPAKTTATVASYDAGTAALCLEGGSVKDQPGVSQDDRLCGTWSHSRGLRTPRKGDRFRFISMERARRSGEKPAVVIFGTVVE